MVIHVNKQRHTLPLPPNFSALFFLVSKFYCNFAAEENVLDGRSQTL